jgi:hypothetical protein
VRWTIYLTLFLVDSELIIMCIYHIALMQTYADDAGT